MFPFRDDDPENDFEREPRRGFFEWLRGREREKEEEQEKEKKEREKDQRKRIREAAKEQARRSADEEDETRDRDEVEREEKERQESGMRRKVKKRWREKLFKKSREVVEQLRPAADTGELEGYGLAELMVAERIETLGQLLDQPETPKEQRKDIKVHIDFLGLLSEKLSQPTLVVPHGIEAIYETIVEHDEQPAAPETVQEKTAEERLREKFGRRVADIVFGRRPETSPTTPENPPSFKEKDSTTEHMAKVVDAGDAVIDVAAEKAEIPTRTTPVERTTKPESLVEKKKAPALVIAALGKKALEAVRTVITPPRKSTKNESIASATPETKTVASLQHETTSPPLRPTETSLLSPKSELKQAKVAVEAGEPRAIPEKTPKQPSTPNSAQGFQPGSLTPPPPPELSTPHVQDTEAAVFRLPTDKAPAPPLPVAPAPRELSLPEAASSVVPTPPPEQQPVVAEEPQPTLPEQSTEKPFEPAWKKKRYDDMTRLELMEAARGVEIGHGRTLRDAFVRGEITAEDMLKVLKSKKKGFNFILEFRRRQARVSAEKKAWYSTMAALREQRKANARASAPRPRRAAPRVSLPAPLRLRTTASSPVRASRPARMFEGRLFKPWGTASFPPKSGVQASKNETIGTLVTVVIILVAVVMAYVVTR